VGRRYRAVIVGMAAATALVLCAGLVVLGISTGFIQVNRPSTRDHPIRGLDVSNHQQPLDWAKVRKAGYSFVYVKATEGGDWTDGRYAQHTAGARAAGLRVGAYHYFTFCRDGAEQARHAVDVVRPLTRPGDLPLVVDLEFGGNCSRTPTVAELDREYGKFDAIVRQAFGRAPILYVTSDLREKYVAGSETRGSALADHRLWIRDLMGRPAGGCGRWSFWQYANGGRVDGAEGAVDLNAYCGDAAAMEREFGAAPSGTAPSGTAPSGTAPSAAGT
jgi:lysozyme